MAVVGALVGIIFGTIVAFTSVIYLPVNWVEERTEIVPFTPQDQSKFYVMESSRDKVFYLMVRYEDGRHGIVSFKVSKTKLIYGNTEQEGELLILRGKFKGWREYFFLVPGWVHKYEVFVPPNAVLITELKPLQKD